MASGIFNSDDVYNMASGLFNVDDATEVEIDSTVDQEDDE